MRLFGPAGPVMLMLGYSIGNVRLDDARPLFTYQVASNGIAMHFLMISQNEVTRKARRGMQFQVSRSFEHKTRHRLSPAYDERQLRVINEGSEKGSRPRLLMLGIKDNVRVSD